MEGGAGVADAGMALDEVDAGDGSDGGETPGTRSTRESCRRRCWARCGAWTPCAGCVAGDRGFCVPGDRRSRRTPSGSPGGPATSARAGAEAGRDGGSRQRRDAAVVPAESTSRNARGRREGRSRRRRRRDGARVRTPTPRTTSPWRVERRVDDARRRVRAAAASTSTPLARYGTRRRDPKSARISPIRLRGRDGGVTRIRSVDGSGR